jgi:Condensation domain
LVALTQSAIDKVVARVPGGSRNVQDIYPLAPLQEGMLVHHLLSTEGDAYVMRSLLAFDGRARLDQFLGALQAVIDRHDALRTAIHWEGLPEPLQIVWRRAPLPVEELALAPDDDGEQELWNRRHSRIDVSQAPLLRVLLAHDAPRSRWLVLLQCHHLAIDHITLELMFAEVRALLEGRIEQLGPAIPFRNFVAQARLGIRREEHEVFFRRMLGDVSEPTAPFGLLDVRGDGSGIEEAQLSLDPDLARRLRAQVRRLGVTASSVFHLAWALVLARTGAREDVVFGTVLFGRMHGSPSIDRAFGLLMNTLPLRFVLDDTPVAEAVRDTHARLGQLLLHEHASLALAQRCSALPAGTPLFSALLNYRYDRKQVSMSPDAALLPGVRLLRVEERTNYPFTLSVDDHGAGFKLTAQVADRIDPARVCRLMHTALEHLVQALDQAPETKVRSLQVLSAAADSKPYARSARSAGVRQRGALGRRIRAAADADRGAAIGNLARYPPRRDHFPIG